MARYRNLVALIAVLILALGAYILIVRPGGEPAPVSPLPATHTPVPPQAVPTQAPCSVVATRTPPTGAPTLVPSQPGDPVRYVDPHIEICMIPGTLKVGDTVSVVGEPVDVGLPIYSIFVQDEGTSEPARLADVTYGNEITPSGESSQVLEFVSAEGGMSRAVFVLRALKPGTALVRIAASGEIHYGYPGPAMWGGGGSDEIRVTVSQP
jgi:hypothetical protein